MGNYTPRKQREPFAAEQRRDVIRFLTDGWFVVARHDNVTDTLDVHMKLMKLSAAFALLLVFSCACIGQDAFVRHARRKSYMPLSQRRCWRQSISAFSILLRSDPGDRALRSSLDKSHDRAQAIGRRAVAREQQ